MSATEHHFNFEHSGRAAKGKKSEGHSDGGKGGGRDQTRSSWKRRKRAWGKCSLGGKDEASEVAEKRGTVAKHGHLGA